MSAVRRLRVLHVTLSPPVSAPVEASRTVTYLQSQDTKRDGYCAEMHWDPQLRMLLVGDVGYPGATRLVFAPGEVCPVDKGKQQPKVEEDLVVDAPAVRQEAVAWSAAEPEFPGEETLAAVFEKEERELSAPAPQDEPRKKPKRSWQSKLAGMAGGGNGAGS